MFLILLETVQNTTKRYRKSSENFRNLLHTHEVEGSSPPVSTKKLLKSYDFRSFFFVFRTFLAGLFSLGFVCFQFVSNREGFQIYGCDGGKDVCGIQMCVIFIGCGQVCVAYHAA